MSYLILLFLFMFISPLIRYVSYYSPLLGMLCYVLLIVAFVSYNRRKMKARAQTFYGNANQSRQQQYNQEASNTSSSASTQKKQSDAIDVEYSEEEVS